MKLHNLLKKSEPILLNDLIPDFEIDSLENDSRKCGTGTLFIAASGYVEDIHPFIGSAYQKGCRYFVIDSNKMNEFQTRFQDACFIPSPHIQKSLALISREFYGDPSGKMKLIGITGTSGKTTTAFAVYSILREMNVPAGLIGTIDYRILDEKEEATNTTPEIMVLNRLMARMVEKHVEVLVMEVSSHSLSLGRVDGLSFDICAFTNFSQDHLDFHHNMEEYFQAKLGIFKLLHDSKKKQKTMLVNRELARYEEITRAAEDFPDIKLKAFSVKDSGAQYHTVVKEKSPEGSFIELNGYPLHIRMIGMTNVYNFTLASAILLELGYQASDFQDPISVIQVVGRMESVRNNFGIGVVIDYAHKPDALEKVLATLREIVGKSGRIITVFGCGGDRDRSKRPMMGSISTKLSDLTIITSDNPRTEDPGSIISQIEAGVDKHGNYFIEEDRAKAIKLALKEARRGDIVLIAGKGHENYQIIGRNKKNFSDREEAEKFFQGEG